MDLNMVLGSSPGSDVTMVLVGSAGHLDWHGHNSVSQLWVYFFFKNYMYVCIYPSICF